MKRVGKRQKGEEAENGEGSERGRGRGQESAPGNSLSSPTAIGSHLPHFTKVQNSIILKRLQVASSTSKPLMIGEKMS